MRRIGALMAASENDAEYQGFLAAFREGLQKLGWAEGRNIQIDARWAGLDTEATRRLAKELVGLQPDLEPSMVGKWLELLKEIAPRVMRVAAVYHPETAPYVQIYLDPFKATAPSFGIETIVAPARDMSKFESICVAQARQLNGGLFVVPDPYMLAHRSEVASLAARYRLPAVYINRAFADAGGLLSYGNDILDNYRRAASYADRILKGEKPGELPAQFPVKFELVINLKTAKTLGLDVPWFLQQRADQVIE